MNPTTKKNEQPVFQSFHTGKWGFERVHDCPDLSRAVYGSKSAASRAKNLADKNAADNDPEDDYCLYDSETSDSLSCADLDISLADYRKLLVEGLAVTEAEGHFRPEILSGRRVYVAPM